MSCSLLTRRLLLSVAGMTLLLSPSRAQQTRHHRIAYLFVGSRASTEVNFEAFRQGLRALGYGDEDIAIERRWADGNSQRLRSLADELVKLGPEVIVAHSYPETKAASQATTTIQSS